MKKAIRRYEEILEKEFLADHNITPGSSYLHPHIHSQLEILLPCSEGLICQLEHETIPVPRHHMMLMNHGDLHLFYVDPSVTYDRYVFYFSPSVLAGLSSPGVNLLDCFYLRPEGAPRPLPIPPAELGSILSLADTLVHYYNVDPAEVYGTELYRKTYLVQFLLKVNQFYQEYHQLPQLSGKDLTDKELVYELLDYIHLHYQEPLSIDDLSSRFLMSKTRLYEIFPMVTGEAPGNYILKFRLSKTKELLSAGYSVELAGQQCGFTNLSHFSRIFKQICGISPKQYQKQEVRRNKLP